MGLATKRRYLLSEERELRSPFNIRAGRRKIRRPKGCGTNSLEMTAIEFLLSCSMTPIGASNYEYELAYEPLRPVILLFPILQASYFSDNDYLLLRLQRGQS